MAWSFADIITGISAFFAEIPIIGAGFKAAIETSEKNIAQDKADADAAATLVESERQDRLATIEAETRQKNAEKELLDATTKFEQAAMDAEMNKTLAEEAGLMALQEREKGAQAAEQIQTKGALTLGSQQAMLAATGQIGAGSATGLMEQTGRNIEGDVSTTLANSELAAGVHDTRAGGYSTLAESLGNQADTYKEYADEIDPEAEYDAYLKAYHGS